MRVATCIHKGDRLCLCESKRCHKDYKGCTKTHLFKFITGEEYLLIIDLVIATKKSIEELLR